MGVKIERRKGKGGGGERGWRENEIGKNISKNVSLVREKGE